MEEKIYTSTVAKGYHFCVRKPVTQFVKASGGGLTSQTMEPSIWDTMECMVPYNPERKAKELGVEVDELIEVIEKSKKRGPGIVEWENRPIPKAQRFVEEQLAVKDARISDLEKELAEFQAMREQKAQAKVGKPKK